MSANKIIGEPRSGTIRALVLGTVTASVLGAVISASILALASRQGVGAQVQLCAILPYILLGLCIRKFRQRCAAVTFFLLALLFSVAGNSVCFNAVILRPSGGMANTLWSVALLQLVILFVTLLVLGWLRSLGAGEPTRWMELSPGLGAHPGRSLPQDVPDIYGEGKPFKYRDAGRPPGAP